MSDRFGVIDPAALGDMTVIEMPSDEDILARRLQSFKRRWTESDPPFGAAYDVENVEFDPARIVMEVGTAYETGLRVRVNQAAKDTTLAFGFGINLDAIASSYPGGCPRLPIVAAPRPYREAPEDWEPDDRYRRRIWLATNAFNTAGSPEGYEYWALTAAPTVKDVSATAFRTSDGPIVRITLLNTAEEPQPTAEQILAVRRQLDRRDVRPLTDVVTVGGPEVYEIEYAANVYLYPGPDRDAISKILNERLAKHVADSAFLGHDHTQLAYAGLLNIDGVTHSAEMLKPARDTLVGETGFVRVAPNPRVTVMETRRQ